jgi:hypothetical protein
MRHISVRRPCSPAVVLLVSAGPFYLSTAPAAAAVAGFRTIESTGRRHLRSPAGCLMCWSTKARLSRRESPCFG